MLEARCTIHVVHLEQELELVGLAAVDEQVQSLEELVQADGAAAVSVKQGEEPLCKERLCNSRDQENLSHSNTQQFISLPFVFYLNRNTISPACSSLQGIRDPSLAPL